MKAEEKFLKDVMLLIGDKVNEEQMEYNGIYWNDFIK